MIHSERASQILANTFAHSQRFWAAAALYLPVGSVAIPPGVHAASEPEHRTPTSQPAPAATAEISAAAKYFTDTPLVNQHGETLRFYSDLLKDRVVSINTFSAPAKVSVRS